MPFDNFIETYLLYLSSERGLARNTISAYQRDLEKFALFDLPEPTHPASTNQPSSLFNYASLFAKRF